MILGKVSPATIFIATILLADFAFVASANKQNCPAVKGGSFCPQGCWNASTTTFADESSNECKEVGSGFFSPENDGLRYPCEPGTFSNTDKAAICISCPAGTYASLKGQSECLVCPSGTFSGMPGSSYCSLCDSAYYDGEGANSLQVWGGIPFCVLSTALTALPSAEIAFAPSAAPSKKPSSHPTSEDSSTQPTDFFIESINQTLGNALTSSGFIRDEFSTCKENFFAWHRKCSKCSSGIRSILLPIILVVGVPSIMALIFHLPAHAMPVFWIGLEYMQILYLLRLSPLPWTKAFGWLQTSHLLSILSLDVNSVLSMQCIFGASPKVDQIWILVLPMLAVIVTFAIPRVKKQLPDLTGCMAVLFYMGHTKLMLTSLESMRCSSSSWFCSNHIPMALLGSLGLVLYGLALPVWLIRALHKKETEHQSGDSTSHWTYRFPCHPARFQWTAFFMIRKTVLVIALAIFVKSRRLTLLSFLVAVFVSDILQRTSLASIDDANLKTSRWFQSKAVDMVLYLGLLIFCGISCAITFSSSSPTPSSQAAILTISFFAICIASALYWVVALALSALSSTEDETIRPRPEPPIDSHDRNPSEDAESREDGQETSLPAKHTDLEFSRIDADASRSVSSRKSVIAESYNQGAATLPLCQASDNAEAIVLSVDSGSNDVCAKFQEINSDEGTGKPLDHASLKDSNGYGDKSVDVEHGSLTEQHGQPQRVDSISMIIDFWKKVDPKVLDEGK